MPRTEGSALVTNTMVYEASRLIDGVEGARYDLAWSAIARLFDLCCLVEAVVLYDRLTTIEGVPGGLHQDHDALSLRRVLIAEGILEGRAVGLAASSVEKCLGALVGSRWADHHGALLSMALECESLSRHPLEEFLETRVPITDDTPLIDVLGRGDLERWWYFTDRRCALGHLVRGAVYCHAAAELGRPIFLDYARVPFAQAYVERTGGSVVEKAYHQFASRLSEEAQDFLVDARPLGLPIPPFTAVMLSWCESGDDVAPQLLKLRSENRDLRKRLGELHWTMLNSKDIRERNRARAKVERAFQAANDRLDVDGFTWFERLMGFAEHASKPLYDPGNPESYTASLLGLPARELRKWWSRRPLGHFFSVIKEFREIAGYNTLATRVFGVTFSDDDVARFARYWQVVSQACAPGRGGPALRPLDPRTDH